MANLTVRYLLVVFILSSTAIVIYKLKYDSSHDQTAGLAALQNIPMQFGNWQGEDLFLEESVYSILETRAIIHRKYSNEQDDSIYLSMVHYYDTKVNFHAPEACLGGRGERTKKINHKIEIKEGSNTYSLDIAKILSSSVNGTSVSYYFYRTGGFMGRSYIKMRFQLAQNAFKGLGKSGSLIRVTGHINNSKDQQNVEQLIKSFMEKLLPVIKNIG